MSIYTRKKKFHFVGIGGVGMSGLAEILLSMGHIVSGSDREKSELTDYLAKKGAQIFEGHDAKNVQQADYLIYSSAIPAENPELKKAHQLAIPLIRRAEMLGQLFNRKLGVGIAGTHGKTTTTSMLGEVLVQANVDPTIIVGGRIRNWMTNARLGQGPILIAEADEYDRSFMALFPRIAVITSLEEDHLDIYKDLNDLKETFVRFANQTAFDGVVVACTDDENIREIIPEIETTVITYGLDSSSLFRADNLSFKEQATEFDVWHENELLGNILLKVPGSHNVKNALAVCAAASELEIPFATIKQALGNFSGVGRRFEILGLVDDILIVDDYAHHPTEIRATLQSARKGWERRILAVFQPHLYSRTRDFYLEFARALDLADLAIITDVYPAREKPVPGISGQMISDALSVKNYYIAEKDILPDFLITKVKPGDMVLFLGAGNITQLAHLFFTKLKREANV